jgi:hypothetical protein
MEATMKRDYEPAPAGDEILSDEEDAAIAAWTLDDLDPAESNGWTAMGDDQSG